MISSSSINNNEKETDIMQKIRQKKKGFQTDDDLEEKIQKPKHDVIDFSNVDFNSEEQEDSYEENDPIVYLTEQASQTLAELLNTMETREQYVQSALKAIERELKMSFEMMQGEYFSSICCQTIQKLVEISRQYIQTNKLSQARSILIKSNEMIDVYTRKRVDLQVQKIDLGNSLSMLEARMGNYQHALDIIEDTIMLQKKFKVKDTLGVSYLNKCKVLSLMNRHEDACRMARAALIEIKREIEERVQELQPKEMKELYRRLVTCFYNIGVEENYVQNFDVAIKNYENALITGKQYLGEEDPLTQLVKQNLQQFRKSLMTKRKQEMTDYDKYNKTKFVIKDRRLAAEESKRSQMPLNYGKSLDRKVSGRILSAHIESSNSRPKAVKFSITGPVGNFNSSLRTLKYKTPADSMTFENRTPQNPKSIKKTPLPNNELFSRTTGYKKKKVPDYFDNSDVYQSDAPSRAVKGTSKEPEFKKLERIGVLSWTDDIGQSMQGKPGDVIILQEWEQQELDGEELYELQKKNCTNFLDSIKNFQAQFQHRKVQPTKKINQDDQKPLQINESDSKPLQITDAVYLDGGPPTFQEKSDEHEEKSVQQQSREKTPPASNHQIEEFVQKENRTSSIHPEETQKKSKTKIQRVAKPAAEQRAEYNQRMMKEMEDFLLQQDQQQQELSKLVISNGEKAETMREFNKKKKEQMHGAMLGLELLQERYNEQTRKLEEMKKQEQHQLKVIEVLQNKKNVFLQQYNDQIRIHFSAKVILRYLRFSKERRQWENEKLKRNSNLIVLREFRNVKLPQRIDQGKLQIKVQQQIQKQIHTSNVKSKSKKISNICYGLLGVYLQVDERMLVIKFFAPIETFEIEKKRVILEHKIQMHEVDFYFGTYKQSETTRSIVRAVFQKSMELKIIADYGKNGLVIENFDYQNNFFIEDCFNDLVNLQIKLQVVSQIQSVLVCKDLLFQQEAATQGESVSFDNAIYVDNEYLWHIVKEKKTILAARVFRDEVDINLLYKILIYQDQGVIHALLRYYGQLDSLFIPNEHFALRCIVKSQQSINGIKQNSQELPLYFEINLEKKLFRARPKALRDEDMIKIQRAVRRHQAIKKLKIEIKKLYQYHKNKVYCHRDYKFWLRVFKTYSTSIFTIAIETLDLKVFMNEDQKRMQAQFNVDQQSAIKMAKDNDPLKYFLINEHKYNIKLMKLVLEQLRDQDVRNLQRRLRRAVAKKNLERKMSTIYQLLLAKKRLVDGRWFFLRLYIKLDSLRYHLDACDIIRKSYRQKSQKKYYFAEMEVVKFYGDIALKLKNPENLFKFDFNNRGVNYSDKIPKIQRAMRAYVYAKRNRTACLQEQILIFQTKFEFKGIKLLIQLIERIVEGGKKIAYICSLTKKQKQFGYMNSVCSIDFETIELTKREKKLQNVYEINFQEKTLGVFIMDIEKVKYIQRFWIRKVTHLNFLKHFQTLYISTYYYDPSDRLFYCMFLNKENNTITFYAQSLKSLKIISRMGGERFKVKRKDVKNKLQVTKDMIKRITPVFSINRVFFDFEMTKIYYLQQWGKMKYIQYQLKTKPKQLLFILMMRKNIKDTQYMFGIYLVKKTKVFKTFLFALKPKNRLLKEKQYFLHEKISYLLTEEIFGCTSPFQKYITIGQLAELQQIIFPLKTTSLNHQEQEIPIKIILNKQLQKIVISADDSIKFIPGHYYLQTFDYDFIDRVVNNFIVYAFKWRSDIQFKIGALQKSEIKCILKIQKAFRKNFYKSTQQIKIKEGVVAEIKLSKIGPALREVTRSPKILSKKDDDINAIFPPVLLNQADFQNKSSSLRIEIWREPNYSLYYKERCLGSTNTTFDELFQDVKKETILKKGNKAQGYLRILSSEPYQRNMFIDYMRSGQKFYLSVAIDFSFHNGTDCKNKNSLHYQDPRKPNRYELCLNLKILPEYIQELRLYGYSAVPPNMGSGISHSFPLTWDVGNHIVNGFSEVRKLYSQAVQQVTPSGPACLEQVFLNAKSLAQELKWSKGFLNLLILLSTENEDTDECLKILDALDTQPNLSIIILGIGKFNSNYLVHEAQQQGKSFVHFYHVEPFLNNISKLEEKILFNIRSDFLNYAKYSGIEIDSSEVQSVQ